MSAEVAKMDAVGRLNVAIKRIEKLTAALKFIGDLAGEELSYAKVGTGAEIVLRHIVRRVHETVVEP